MPSSITTAKQSWATSAATGAAGTTKELLSGTAPIDNRWDRVRGQIARAYLVDPDCFFMQMYLGSNKLFGVAKELSTVIDRLLVYGEGTLYPSLRAPNLANIPDRLTSSISKEALAEYQKLLAARASTCAANTKIGGRFVQRGEEAKNAYYTELASFFVAYYDFQATMSLLTSASPDFSKIRELAVLAARDRANTAASAAYSANSSASLALQTAAAAAALTVTNRLPNLAVRAAYNQVFVPQEVEFTYTGTVITWKTGSPSLCYLRVGDTVAWATGETTVIAVNSTSAIVAAPIVGASTLIIRPGPYADFETFQKSCEALLDAMRPADSILRQQLADLSSTTAIRNALLLLLDIQAALTGLSAAALSTTERLNIQSAATSLTPATTILKTYAPTLSSSTKATTRAIVTLLDDEGFALSLVRFLQGDLSFLSEETAAQQASSYFYDRVGG